ncbi:MAG: hypothetical protein GMKNLPBB_01590 [Myxococcota bacterium]|nr:hypothetical protein [Myxococcota bacterium]
MAIAILMTACGYGGISSGSGLDYIPNTGAASYQYTPLTVCLGARKIVARENGFCSRPPSSGRACARDADCRDREGCNCGVCVLRYCDLATRTDCLAPLRCVVNRCLQPCKSDADCGGKGACVRDNCQPSCSSDDDCANGEQCKEGQCAVIKTCRLPSECSSTAGDFCSAAAISLSHPAVVDSQTGFTLLANAQSREYSGLFQLRGDQPGRLEFLPATITLRGEPPPWMWNGVSNVFVLNEEGERRVYFQALDADSRGSVGLAKWTGDALELLSASPVAQAQAGWEGGSIESPAVVKLPNGRYLMGYTSRQGTGFGVRASADGLTFDPPPPTPVLVPEQFEREGYIRRAEALADPEMRVLDTPSGPVIQLWISLQAIEAVKLPAGVQPQSNFSIAYAASRDGVTWEPYPWNPVLDVVEFAPLPVHRDERGAAIAGNGARTWMYFHRNQSRGQALGLAVSPAPRTPGD